MDNKKEKRWIEIIKKKKAIVFILLSTIFTSFGQIFWKWGVNQTDYFWIISGFVFYFIAASLMVISFKFGELSVVYPIIGTSYIWVSFLSLIFLNESMNLLKWLGVFFILVGVSLVARK